METTEALQKELTKVFDNFISLLGTIAPELMNAEPKTGSWTIGQLGQHILLATTGLPDRKNKPADRPADQFEKNIREIFLDDSKKFKSPEFIEPEKRKYEKELLLSTLEKNRSVLLKIVREEHLDNLCLDAEFPGCGYLTRYEWIKLNIYHMQRHLKQLEKLKNF